MGDALLRSINILKSQLNIVYMCAGLSDEKGGKKNLKLETGSKVKFDQAIVAINLELKNIVALFQKIVSQLRKKDLASHWLCIKAKLSSGDYKRSMHLIQQIKSTRARIGNGANSLFLDINALKTKKAEQYTWSQIRLISSYFDKMTLDNVSHDLWANIAKGLQFNIIDNKLRLLSYVFSFVVTEDSRQQYITPFVVLTTCGKLIKSLNIEPTLEMMLQLFTQYAQYLINKKISKLKSFFGRDYKKALSLFKDLEFAKKWLQFLSHHSKTVLLLKNQSVRFALQVKNLLCDLKNQLYGEIYQQNAKQNTNEIVLLELFISDKGSEDNKDGNMLSPEVILRKMIQKTGAINLKIKLLEDKLKDYSWMAGIASSIIRVFTKSSYFVLAKSFITEADAVTANRLKSTPILNTKLSNFYKEVFTLLLTGGFIWVDARFSKIADIRFIPTKLINILNWSLTSLSSIIPYTDKFSIDRALIVQNLSKIRWILDFMLFLTFSGVLDGFSQEVMIFFAGSHVVYSICGWLSGFLLDSDKYVKMKAAVEYGSSLAGAYLWRSNFHHIRGFFRPVPSNQQLLNDTKLCLEYKAKCREAAVRELGLDINATEKEIRNRFRFLSLKHHPDRKEGNTESYMRVANAKEILDELRDNKHNSKI